MKPVKDVCSRRRLFCLPEHKRWHFLSFKVPFGPVPPIVGIAEIIYMILNISTDPVERNMIWLVTGITFAILAVYSFFWIKFKMKMPVFKSVPLEKVMAMETVCIIKYESGGESGGKYYSRFIEVKVFITEIKNLHNV